MPPLRTVNLPVTFQGRACLTRVDRSDSLDPVQLCPGVRDMKRFLSCSVAVGAALATWLARISASHALRNVVGWHDPRVASKEFHNLFLCVSV
jgi:hypothetical protein